MSDLKKYICVFSVIFIIIYLLYTVYKRRVHKKKHKVAVLLFGFSPRSFRYTYNEINNNIIKELDKHYYTDVYHHTLLSKTNTLDSFRKEEQNNNKIDNNDYKKLNTNSTICYYQEDIKNPFTTILEKNHYRALYSELEVSKFLNKTSYDACIVLSNDAMPIKKIDKNEVDDVINHKNILYTTSYNKWGGLGNGFYITTPNIFKIIANRIHLYENWIKNKMGNAESFLSSIVSHNKDIVNKDSDMFYLKIRNNGKSNYYIDLIDKFNVPYKWYYVLRYKQRI
jgi:hypothetical protein